MFRRFTTIALGIAALALVGCAGPGPKLFPAGPIAREALPDGRSEHRYDLDRDGRADFAELLSRSGRVAVLRYDINTASPTEVDLAAIDLSECRHLVLLLDSIPYEMVADAWRQGRFRLFPPPSRVISPFPVMTDIAFTAFFGAEPGLAVESQFFDGHRLRGGYDAYAGQENTAWQRGVDYVLSPIAHVFAYTYPNGWYEHELGRIQHDFYRSRHSPYVGYIVSTSALGAKFGRNGHQTGLARLDRLCQHIMHHYRGRVQITLFSDHGHNLMFSRRLDLSEVLARCGYHVGDALRHPGDVVVPEFGVVTYAGIHTREPANVARDLAGVEGVQLIAYMDGDALVVVSRDGRARIHASNNSAEATGAAQEIGSFRYEPEFGDPLHLGPPPDVIGAQFGFVSDRVLFDASKDGPFPDAVYRLWHAFHGQTRHTPDVLVSIEDGYHCGSKLMSKWLDLAAAHGNLGPLSSTAFAMTTAGELPPVLRMRDLRAALQQLGVPIASEPRP